MFVGLSYLNAKETIRSRYVHATDDEKIKYNKMAKREEKPVYIRTGKVQMRKGGESDPRNKALMKMFNLINIGERAGSGVPNIFSFCLWQD